MPGGHVHMQHPSLLLLWLVLMARLLLVVMTLMIEVQLCPLPLPRLLRYHTISLVLQLLWQLLRRLLLMVVAQLRRRLQARARGRGRRLGCRRLRVLSWRACAQQRGSLQVAEEPLSVPDGSPHWLTPLKCACRLLTAHQLSSEL